MVQVEGWLARNHSKLLVAGAGLLVFLVLLVNLVTASQETRPPSWPAQPIKIVVTFPPGGGTDLLARKLGERLAAQLGQTVLIENRPGASGNIGARVVAESAADGYTLLMVNSSFAVNPAVYQNLPFAPDKDFAAVINVAHVPSVLLVPADSPAHTLAEWLGGHGAQRDARGALPAYATCGNGTPQHMAGELLARAAEQRLQHVPYKGCGPALAAVAGGQVGAAIVTASSAAPLIAAGQVRALALTSAQRSPLLPEVASIAEQGWPGYDLDQWHGLLAPAGTPAEVIARLNATLRDIVQTSAMQSALRALGFNPVTEPAASTPQAFQALIAADLTRFSELAAQLGLRLD